MPSWLATAPVKPLFFGSLAVGTLGGIGLQRALADDNGHTGLGARVAGILVGFGVMDAALAVGMRIEREPGPYVDRWSVDAVEQVGQRRVSLHWGPKATRVGAVLAALGFGIGVASLTGTGTRGLRPPDKA